MRGYMSIAAGLIVPIVLAAPPAKDLLFCRLFSKPSPEKMELIKNYCDYSAICFQILIAITIGGIAITESAAYTIRSKINVIQASQLAQFDKKQRDSIRRMIKMYLDIRYVGTGLTSDNALTRTKKLISDIFTLSIAVFGARSYTFYAMLIGLRIGTAFPGGLYGVIAFILFEGLIISQVVKTYFDYAPACG